MGSFAQLQLRAASDGLRLSRLAFPSSGARGADVMDLLKICVLCQLAVLRRGWSDYKKEWEQMNLSSVGVLLHLAEGMPSARVRATPPRTQEKGLISE